MRHHDNKVLMPESLVAHSVAEAGPFFVQGWTGTMNRKRRMSEKDQNAKLPIPGDPLEVPPLSHRRSACIVRKPKHEKPYSALNEKLYGTRYQYSPYRRHETGLEEQKTYANSLERCI